MLHVALGCSEEKGGGEECALNIYKPSLSKNEKKRMSD